MTRPVVLAAHGTADADGLTVLERVRAAVAEALPGQAVSLGYVDVAAPHVRDLLRAIPDGVVVPLFVTAGYHVRSDLPAVVADAAPGALLTPHLGALPGFAAILAGRARAAAAAADQVCLVVTGSSDDRARAEADHLGSAVGRLLGRDPLPVAHLSGPGLPVAEVRPAPDLLVSTLLAPGYFQGRLVVGCGWRGRSWRTPPRPPATGEARPDEPQPPRAATLTASLMVGCV